jgi:hypothetical protein
MQSKTLDMYSLGAPDAWWVEERDILRDMFLQLNEYSDISDSTKVFLCGRRGSGKSAIARMLVEQSQRTYKEAVPGEEKEYGAYMRVVERLCDLRDAGNNVDIKGAIKLLWQWALPVKVMQTVLHQANEFGEPLDPNLEVMTKYIESLKPEIHARSPMGYVLTSTFQEAEKHLKEGNLYNYLLRLSSSVPFTEAIGALKAKTLKRNTLIVFDTLESYKIYSPAMVDGLSGVVESIISFLGSTDTQNISVKFFLPAEIYEKIVSSIPSKASYSTVFLRWTVPDLITMLSKRFLMVLKRTSAVSEQQLTKLEIAVDEAYKKRDGRHLRDEFWYNTGFLPRTILNTATVRREEDSFAYIIRHTFRRPRDFVFQLMQTIVNYSALAKEFPYIKDQTVITGVHDRSKLMAILGDALTPFHTGEGGDLVNDARTVFHDRPRIMNGRELRHFGEDLYSISPSWETDPSDFLRLLLRSGVVGIPYTNDTRLGKSNIYIKTRFEHLLPDTIPLRDDLQYCVHPVMSDLFDMKQLDDGMCVYPLTDQDNWLESVSGI